MLLNRLSESAESAGITCESEARTGPRSAISRSSSRLGYGTVTRARNRSCWASGRGNVPSNSTGFCVATTQNGSGNCVVSRPTVTCPSSMASSKALCTLAGARLISSANKIWVKTGPDCRTNRRSKGSYMTVPVKSPGRRSGVNCTRPNRRSSN